MIRLLNIYSLQLHEFNNERDAPPYVIASHRWEHGEATFKDLTATAIVDGPGIRKVRRFCDFIRTTPGFLNASWLWIDTCCIDKTNSQELTEAINSMYRWYSRAYLCLAYLHDVRLGSELETSEWFTRGWTLQELIAPGAVFFVDQEWQVLGHKAARGPYNIPYEVKQYPCLNVALSQITGIPEEVMSGPGAAFTRRTREKKSWLSMRSTTREEDMAYCMLGLCDVFIPIIYGEGYRNAWRRLREEISRKRRYGDDDNSTVLSEQVHPVRGSGSGNRTTPSWTVHPSADQRPAYSWNEQRAHPRYSQAYARSQHARNMSPLHGFPGDWGYQVPFDHCMRNSHDMQNSPSPRQPYEAPPWHDNFRPTAGHRSSSAQLPNPSIKGTSDSEAMLFDGTVPQGERGSGRMPEADVASVREDSRTRSNTEADSKAKAEKQDGEEMKAIKALIWKHEQERVAREKASLAEREAEAAEKAAMEVRLASERRHQNDLDEATRLARLEVDRRAEEEKQKLDEEFQAKLAKLALDEEASRKAQEEMEQALATARKPVEKPIRFKDAVGRKFTYPWHIAKVWKGMETLIKQAFLHVDELGKLVRAGHYDLTGPNGELILPHSWGEEVQPGWQISMHMWPTEEPNTSTTVEKSIDTNPEEEAETTRIRYSRRLRPTSCDRS